jgi:hypothetical protein
MHYIIEGIFHLKGLNSLEELLHNELKQDKIDLETA